MYLYHSRSAESKRRDKTNETPFSKTVGKELEAAALARVVLKDTTSAKLQIKGPRQADAVLKADLHVLRQELQLFPVGLRETARSNLLLDQNIKRKDLQDFQCTMMGKIESILRQQMLDNGLNYRKYKVGGYDKGTYELFFRIQPGRLMTKAQLTTALRRSFGPELVQSQTTVNKLFDSFDFYRADEMDWRAFLYLLCLLMQPYLFCGDLLMYGYAIYSSVGSLDLDCSEKLSLGMIKDMLCAPVILSLRSELRHEFDAAWLSLSNSDQSVFNYAAHTQTTASRMDPDEFQITYKIFRKIMTKTSFTKYLEMARPFGKLDLRPWTCVLEETYYHPRVLKNLKRLRREERSQVAADQFIAKADVRKKGYCFSRLVEYMSQRMQLRLVLIGMEVRSMLVVMGLKFDKWRKVSIEISCRLTLQRCARGFIARQRRHFIKRLRENATTVQSGTRQLLQRIKFHKQMMRNRWAATTIQRIVRGRQARRRTATLVEALYDTGMRLLKQRREEWEASRLFRAATAIQMWRRWQIVARRCRMARDLRRRAREVAEDMDDQHEAARVEQEVYKNQITQWYQERKTKYEDETFNDSQTAQQRKEIMKRRAKFAAEAKRLQEIEREERIKRLDEEQHLLWEQKWTEESKRRAETKRKKLNNILVLPESQAELLQKKELEKAIKVQIKDVLRRADKQKIPMEIPEAKDIAAEEVVEQEVQKEIQKVKKEQETERAQIEADKRAKEKKLKDEEHQRRKKRRKAALLLIQRFARNFLARRIARERAYKRYVKHFDIASHEYYYEDSRTRVTQWTKPVVLGSYDIPMDDYWITIPAGNNDIPSVMEPGKTLFYYYHPGTWEQRWKQPHGTILCEVCRSNFAVALLTFDKIKYCENCFNVKATELEQKHGMTKKEITFKPFNGGSPKASALKMKKIKESNWMMHLIALNPALKQSAEEEELERQQRRNRSKSRSLSRSQSGRLLENEPFLPLESAMDPTDASGLSRSGSGRGWGGWPRLSRSASSGLSGKNVDTAGDRRAGDGDGGGVKLPPIGEPATSSAAAAATATAAPSERRGRPKSRDKDKGKKRHKVGKTDKASAGRSKSRGKSRSKSRSKGRSKSRDRSSNGGDSYGGGGDSGGGDVSSLSSGEGLKNDRRKKKKKHHMEHKKKGAGRDGARADAGDSSAVLDASSAEEVGVGESGVDDVESRPRRSRYQSREQKAKRKEKKKEKRGKKGKRGAGEDQSAATSGYESGTAGADSEWGDASGVSGVSGTPKKKKKKKEKREKRTKEGEKEQIVSGSDVSEVMSESGVDTAVSRRTQEKDERNNNIKKKKEDEEKKKKKKNKKKKSKHREGDQSTVSSAGVASSSSPAATAASKEKKKKQKKSKDKEKKRVKTKSGGQSTVISSDASGMASSVATPGGRKKEKREKKKKDKKGKKEKKEKRI